MYLDWELCDLKQSLLTRLDNRRSGGRVELAQNRGRAAFCPLSIEDEAYELAATMETLLRVTLRGPSDWSLPLFIGRAVVLETKDEAGAEEFGISAQDAFFHLERLLIRQVTGTIWEPRVFAATAQEQIMWSLIEKAPVGHGVIKGVLSASGINRDRTYPPTKEIGLALQQMSEVINGPDFEFEPIVLSDGTIARFNTFYPKQGTDKSDDVVFVHREEPNSSTKFNLAPAGDEMCNRCIAIGAPQQEPTETSPYGLYPGYVAEHAASVALYGALEKRLMLEDVIETPTLQAHAQAEVAAHAFPIPYFDFTSAPEPIGQESGDGVPPVFGQDYWIGDTVGCEAHLPALAEPLELAGRITDARLTEDEAGQITTKLSCSIAVSSAGIGGQAVTVKIPEGV